ncbi:hypothetical protein TUBRATIS_28650 [Tubulinosema ratisbonensis]|uniref:V-SNARE coiled-coil homology domain-containing protein n=1 Tax=Tubulinosema ratisbonensis TaxID=291195 RepID=A0A437AHS5_9MICR|nr:hypothetical protein TUBRATIS_28650 [Tubulinosema ratisbonensis]
MPDKLTLVNKEADLLEDTLRDSIKAEQNRGHNILKLENKAERLESRSDQFRVQAKKTKWKLFLKLVKWIVLGILFVVFVYFVFKMIFKIFFFFLLVF